MTHLIPYRARTSRFPAPFADDFFRPFLREFAGRSAEFDVDVIDKGDHYLLEADLPGFDKAELSVAVEEETLTIEAKSAAEPPAEDARYLYSERRARAAKRTFALREIDEAGIAAEYRDGVLRLTLPKRQPPEKAIRRIELI